MQQHVGLKGESFILLWEEDAYVEILLEKNQLREKLKIQELKYLWSKMNIIFV